jgi:hypothetical protein
MIDVAFIALVLVLLEEVALGAALFAYVFSNAGGLW